MADKGEQFEFSPSIYHRRLADRAGQSLSYRGGDVAAWRHALRETLTLVLGLDLQQDSRCPLDVRTLWKRPHPLGTIEKVVFRAEPGADVPAYVCLPASAKPPYVFFICMQGHNTGMHNAIAVTAEDESASQATENDRDFGLSCMAKGIAALCIEQRSFGERAEKILQQTKYPYCHQATMHAIMLGTTLAAQRVFDVDRAIDYLQQRGDADMAHIGVMGNSGGGTTSMYAGAVLGRLQYSMPSCCFSTFRQSIMSIIHCACNYVPGLYHVADMADIAGMFAPRPVVIVAGKDDKIYPIEGARSEFNRLKAIYAAAGAANRCHFVEGQTGHRFYADQAWAVMLKEIRRG